MWDPHPGVPADRTQGFFVANIKSQIKRNRQNERLRLANKAVRSEIKTRTKNAVATVGSEENAEAVRLAIKRIDKAAAKGVIHKNQASNRKGRLMRRLNALNAAK
jgi:small subunit ribosomal protein S20